MVVRAKKASAEAEERVSAVSRSIPEVVAAKTPQSRDVWKAIQDFRATHDPQDATDDFVEQLRRA